MGRDDSLVFLPLHCAHLRNAPSKTGSCFFAKLSLGDRFAGMIRAREAGRLGCLVDGKSKFSPCYRANLGLLPPWECQPLWVSATHSASFYADNSPTLV